MPQKKSSHYNYFKNSNNNNKIDHIKNLKTAFKFLKIFIYLFLLVITLVGCIQGMAFIKTSSYSGTGAELYSNRNNVTVHVTSIMKTNDDKNYPIYTQHLKDNYWVKGDALKQIHKEVKASGGDVAKWDTYNETFRLIDKNSKPLGKDGKRKGAGEGLFKSKKYLIASKSFPYKIEGDNFEVKYFEGSAAPYKVVTYKIEKKDFVGNKEGLIFNSLKYLLNTINGGKAPTTPKDQVKWDKSIDSALRTLGIKITKKTVEKKDVYKVSVKPNIAMGNNNKEKAIISWGDAWSLGPFYGLFVWPLSRLMIALVSAFPILAGWETVISIGIAVLLIRTLAYGVTFKSVLQQVKQQEMGAKKAAIEAKYEAYKGNKQMDRRKQQETADLYKKEGISPLGALGGIFITMPIFIAMWRVIQGIPHIKSTTWLSISFSATSYKELFKFAFQYLPLMILVSGLNGLSQFLPRLLSKSRNKNRINAHQKAAMKKSNRTQNIVMVVFMIIPLIMSAGVQVYWVFGSIFTIFQNLISHKVIQMQSRKRKAARGRG